MKPHTTLVHAGRPAKGPVNTPVYRASTILFADLAEFDKGKDHDRHALTYGRYGTPTTFHLENAVAELEGACAAALAPSGLAAITTALQAYLRPGDHLVMPDSVYGPARRFAQQFLAPRGVATGFYPATDTAALESMLRDDTRVVYLESPGSLTFEMQDIPAITAMCRARGILTIADNTWATPLAFRPLEHGVDVSLQAATKYLVGHSDAMLGTIACTEAAWPALADTVVELGVCVSPDDAFLAARGLRTLGVRLERHARNALAVASWLESQPEVARVAYPPLLSDPGHAIWRRDYHGASGLMGVWLRPGVDREDLRRLVDGLRIFRLGGSWGGFESLAFPVVPSSARGRASSGEPAYMRLHVGLEDLDDMLDDLAAGLRRLHD
jgi:cystathionine beta-lyase